MKIPFKMNEFIIYICKNNNNKLLNSFLFLKLLNFKVKVCLNNFNTKIIYFKLANKKLKEYQMEIPLILSQSVNSWDWDWLWL